jgi:cell wall-associated NlpC family hydrolase
MDNVVVVMQKLSRLSGGHLSDFGDKMKPIPLHTSNELRRQIVTTARKLVGTRFHHQGRVPGLGLDCVGLVAVVGRSLGLFDYDVTDYARLPHEAAMRAHIRAAGFRETDKARAGDVALMRFTREAQHVGILTGPGTECSLIHAWMQAGRVVEHRLDDQWRGRMMATYSFPGVN